jgi:hypothetical protein
MSRGGRRTFSINPFHEYSLSTTPLCCWDRDQCGSVNGVHCWYCKMLPMLNARAKTRGISKEEQILVVEEISSFFLPLS